MHAEAIVTRGQEAPAATQRLRVLLVEDSQRLAASIRDYLERHNYEVFIEGDGLSVGERFERLKPDLVILDLMLPGKDGLTICRELRRHDRIPILILTAKGENIDHVLGLEMGADDYVVKPVEPRVLLARIEALLLGVHLRHDLVGHVHEEHERRRRRQHQQEVEAEEEAEHGNEWGK